MFANYYPHCPVPEIYDSKSRAMSWATNYPATVTVPVAVIPLDDVPALTSIAFNAFCDAMDNNMDSMECVTAALTAIGVLPKKGRK